MKRRHFLQGSAALATTATTQQALSAAPTSDKAVALKNGDVILFQGDSITDAGRDRKAQSLPNDSKALGRGYPAMLAGALLADHADLGLQIYNRGISGHKVPDLDARWQVDTIELKPAVLSILIGVNDIWHKLNGRYDGTPEVYRDGFAALLKRTRTALPDTLLVICEPFVMKCGAVNDKWFPEFEERRSYAEKVAKDAGAIWVPFQQVFNVAIAGGTTPPFWADDGVHPSVPGHSLMANAWRKCVGI